MFQNRIMKHDFFSLVKIIGLPLFWFYLQISDLSVMKYMALDLTVINFNRIRSMEYCDTHKNAEIIICGHCVKLVTYVTVRNCSIITNSRYIYSFLRFSEQFQSSFSLCLK